MKVEFEGEVLSTEDKVKIIARNEDIPHGNLRFEMSASFAPLLREMNMQLEVISKDEIRTKLAWTILYSMDVYEEDGSYRSGSLPKITMQEKLAKDIADGKLKPGDNIDYIMRDFESEFLKREEIRKNNKRIETRLVVERKSREAIEREERKKSEAHEALIKDKAAKAQAEKDKARQTWIEANGSGHLKKATAAGYPCGKLFDTEFGAKALGDEYIYDRFDNIKIRDRPCPSEQALDESLEIAKKPEVESARVVWLPEGLVETDDVETDSTEAIYVIIKGLQGRFLKRIY